MKRIIQRSIVAVAALSPATPLLAHTGNHDEVGPAETLSHVLAHADHLAPVLALMAIALVVFAARRRKQSIRR